MVLRGGRAAEVGTIASFSSWYSTVSREVFLSSGVREAECGIAEARARKRHWAFWGCTRRVSIDFAAA